MPPRKVPSSTVFILGAGFSAVSGLPVQKNLAPMLLKNPSKNKIDTIITGILKNFLTATFDWSGKKKDLPSLEDIFTCIDLAAGSGHTLGKDFPPNKLRAVRRMAIHRILTVLDQGIRIDDSINNLIDFFSGLNPFVPDIKSSFVVTNWDIALERYLELRGRHNVSYGLSGYDWQTGQPHSPDPNIAFPVCKMHGSGNWAYCENCKSLFFDFDGKFPVHMKMGLIREDFALFGNTYDEKEFQRLIGVAGLNQECKLCKEKQLASHIATFSYRKSFRTHAYSSVWYSAEQLLSKAAHWVFVGYSLPQADYEFKHLLKTAQVKMLTNLQTKQCRKEGWKPIDVVVKEKKRSSARKAVRENYKNFFGEKNVEFYGDSVEDYCKSVLGI
jgi:hypothetical protein